MKTSVSDEVKTSTPPPRDGGGEQRGVIDTSKMSDGQRAALELAEASRGRGDVGKSFGGSLLMGRPAWSNLTGHPRNYDDAEGEKFLVQLKEFLIENVDPDQIDREGEVPEHVLTGLAEMGAFGIKIPKDLGGLGYSQSIYSRAAILLGSYCGNLTALLSAHQSIGVPQPLLMFGTDEQKKKYLPRVAKGEISAFALTEDGVGSDPARMETVAEPSEDGEYFTITGEKLWCTNGTKAGVFVVMARTPSVMVRGREKSQITAFIVERDMPGVEVVTRCRFMGLKALYNGVIRFNGVKVPRSNIIEAEGKGLKVALATLNTGRLTLPAACAGLGKQCLRIVREWSASREQWGAPIGRHAAIADKIATMAANVFAMESMVLMTSRMVDEKVHDIRMEAAFCKMWGTEFAWRIVDETMQIRGGRGYETADSLKSRGETPYAIERFMRDCRINTLFEGSSEIMRLFLAREALDPHLKVAGGVFHSKYSMVEKLQSVVKAGMFYSTWYPQKYNALTDGSIPNLHARLRPWAKKINRDSRVLARTLFHQMLRYGPALEKKQTLLGNLIDVGAEIFAMTATITRANEMLSKSGVQKDEKEILNLVNYFCTDAGHRIDEAYSRMKHNRDARSTKLTNAILDKSYLWLEEGIV